MNLKFSQLVAYSPWITCSKFEKIPSSRTGENENFLGDDFLADNDTAYLDIETPNAPTANPSEDLADTDEFGLPRIPESAK